MVSLDLQWNNFLITCELTLVYYRADIWMTDVAIFFAAIVAVVIIIGGNTAIN